MSTEFVLEVFSEVQFFRNDCIMLNFFFLYIYTFYYRSYYYYYYSFTVVSFTFDSIDHPSSASRESVILFVVPSPTKLNKRTKKEKKKNRYVARYARNLVFFLYFRSYENVGLKVYEDRV